MSRMHRRHIWWYSKMPASRAPKTVILTHGEYNTAPRPIAGSPPWGTHSPRLRHSDTSLKQSNVGDQTIKLQLCCYNYWIRNSTIIIEVVALTLYISPGIQLVASSVYGHRVIAAILWDASIFMTIAGCTVWQGQGHCPRGKWKFIWHCCIENYSCQEAFKKSRSYVWPLKHKWYKVVTL